jgi:hypothetical protein
MQLFRLTNPRSYHTVINHSQKIDNFGVLLKVILLQQSPLFIAVSIATLPCKGRTGRWSEPPPPISQHVSRDEALSWQSYVQYRLSSRISTIHIFVQSEQPLSAAQRCLLWYWFCMEYTSMDGLCKASG